MNTLKRNIMHPTSIVYKSFLLAVSIPSLIGTMLVDNEFALHGLLYLFLADLLTGFLKSLVKKGVPLWAVYTIDYWETIASSRLRESLRKGLVYIVAIMCFSVFELMVLGKDMQIDALLLNEELSATRATVILAAMIELWSIGENLTVIFKRNIFLVLLGIILPESVYAKLEKKIKLSQEQFKK